MKLWLDDERPAPDGWVHVKTAFDAIHELTCNFNASAYAEVSLDHDLGEEMTGYDVISWIEEVAFTYNDFCIPIVKVHTANSSARQKMVQAAANIERERAKRLDNVYT